MISPTLRWMNRWFVVCNVIGLGCGPAVSATPQAGGTTATELEAASERPREVSSESAMRRTQRELAEVAFDAVQVDDFDRFRELLLTPEEIGQHGPASAGVEAEEIHQRIVEMNRLFFEEAYAKGEQLGIVWSEARFVGAEKSWSDQRPNVYILFEHAGTPYSMKMDDCIETARGWVIGDYLGAPQAGESHREPVN